MGKFEVQWTEEYWFRVEVEAESAAEAHDKWWAQYTGGDFNVEAYGMELQDSVEVGEID